MPSCKKDSSNSAKSNSAVTLLTSSRWTFQKFEYEEKNGTWIPDPDAVDANKFTEGFNTNNTFTEIDLVNGYNTTGTWNFTSNNTVLTLSNSYDIGQGAAYNVNQLTSSTLVLTDPNYIAVSYIAVRLTFTH